MLRALTHKANFCLLCKKSVTNSLRQVRPVMFRSTKFCQGSPNFKDAVVLLGAVQIFVRREIRQIC